jgi:hypothetical protein
VRRDAPVDRVGVGAGGDADLDIGVSQPEARVDVRGDFFVGFDDVFDVVVDKVVEGVDVLFDEAFDFEEGGQEEPFVLYGFY